MARGTDRSAWIIPGWILIAVAVLLAYWPLSLFQYSLSDGDTLDCWLPWRHFISSALHEGMLPNWNPLQQMGYPIHADLQGPAWYVEAIVLGGTIGMGPHVLQLLFLLYLIIGGCGARMFVLRSVPNDGAAVIAGTAYALCGFFTSHAMHFYAVISAAWLPWIFWALLRFMDRPDLRNVSILAVFLSLLLTGGNHGFLITVFYPIAALLIWRCVIALRQKDHEHLRLFVLNGSLGILMVILMAAGTFHALWEVGPYIDRVHGLGLELAQQGSFTFPALRSLIWPAASTAGETLLGTDPTMANGYFGVIMLLGIAIGIRCMKDTRASILLIFALIYGLAAFGRSLPVHEWLWRWIPGMDLFRFPSYFWYFAVLFLLPIGAFGLRDLLEGKRHQWTVAGAFLLILLSTILLVRKTWMGSGPESAPMFDRMRSISTDTLVMVNAGVLIIVLSIFIFLLFRRKLNAAWLLGLLSIEMIAAIQTTQWHTTLGRNSPAELAARIDQMPKGPVLPLMRPMRENKDDSSILHLLWRNTQVFVGQPTHDGFNSFWMKKHVRLVEDHRALYEHMLSRPLAFLADSISDGDTTAGLLAWDLGRSPPLSPAQHSYGRWVFESEETAGKLLVVQQNIYPGWKIRADGIDLPIVPVNVAAFGAWLPADTRSIEIVQHKPILRWISVISFGTFISLLFFLAFNSQHRSFWIGAVIVVLLLWTYATFGHSSKEERIKAGWTEAAYLAVPGPGRAVIVNTDRSLPMGSDNMNKVRMDLPDDLFELENALDRSELPDTLIMGWYGLPVNTPSRELLERMGYSPLRIKGNVDAGMAELVRNDAISERPILYHDPTQSGIWLHSGNDQWTKAWRKNIAELRDESIESLIISLRYRGKGSCDAHVVIERRRNGEITDHETVPLCRSSIAPSGEHHAIVVRSVPLRRFSGEELGVYVIALGDSVHITDLTVRSGTGPAWIE